MLQALFAGYGHFIFRWLHLFFGIVWIGMLYYFNYVQGAFMAETDAQAKAQVTQKLLPRAMWWFRWGALWTWVTGALMLALNAHFEMTASGSVNLGTPQWITILTGAMMGTIMFLNVWLIIWPAQKANIANAVNVAGGKPADPALAPKVAQAGVASRTNTLFSIPLAFFMVASRHLPFAMSENSNVGAYWAVAILIALGIEANAIFGKTGPMTTIKGVITCGFVLTAVYVVVASAVL